MAIFNSDHSIPFIQIFQQFLLYTKWVKIKPLLETTMFKVPKMEICKWNRSLYHFTKLTQNFLQFQKKQIYN